MSSTRARKRLQQSHSNWRGKYGGELPRMNQQSWLGGQGVQREQPHLSSMDSQQPSMGTDASPLAVLMDDVADPIHALDL